MLRHGVLAVAGVETLFWLYTVALTAMTPKLPERQVSGSAMVLSLASVAFVLFTLPALGFAIWGSGIVFAAIAACIALILQVVTLFLLIS